MANQVSPATIKALREKTGAGMMECKSALSEAEGNEEKAIEILRKRGLATATKKAGRIAAEGLVNAYIHAGGKLGTLIEVNCETDFVAKTDAFVTLVRDLAMQVAATNPSYVAREDVPATVLEKEREIYRQQMADQKKPPQVLDKIVEGKLEKFYSEQCLLEQPFIKDATGKTRVKVGGGNGGHNGLRSIDPQIGTGYRRVRLGVGHPGHKDLVMPHVLGDFSKAEQQAWLTPLLDAVADNAVMIVKGDDNGLMNKLAIAVQGLEQDLLVDRGVRVARTEPADVGTGAHVGADDVAARLILGVAHAGLGVGDGGLVLLDLRGHLVHLEAGLQVLLVQRRGLGLEPVHLRGESLHLGALALDVLGRRGADHGGADHQGQGGEDGDRTHCRRQSDGAHRVRDRPGQADQGHDFLPHEHGPQLRRSAARDRFGAVDGEAQGCNARELEAGRGRDHRSCGIR